MDEKRDRVDGAPLSKRARDYLARAGHPDNADTPERVEEQLTAAGLHPFASVVDTFCRFGGSVLPMGAEGRFEVYRAKRAIRMMRRAEGREDDPCRFRIPIGESETIQASFQMDGHGRIYEDDRPIAESLVAWIEHWAGRSR